MNFQSITKSIIFDGRYIYDQNEIRQSTAERRSKGTPGTNALAFYSPIFFAAHLPITYCGAHKESLQAFAGRLGMLGSGGYSLDPHGLTRAAACSRQAKLLALISPYSHLLTGQ